MKFYDPCRPSWIRCVRIFSIKYRCVRIKGSAQQRRFGPATLKDFRRSISSQSWLDLALQESYCLSVCLSVCLSLSLSLSLLHPVPYCRTDINLRQLSFLKMFLGNIILIISTTLLWKWWFKSIPSRPL